MALNVPDTKWMYFCMGDRAEGANDRQKPQGRRQSVPTTSRVAPASPRSPGQGRGWDLRAITGRSVFSRRRTTPFTEMRVFGDPTPREPTTRSRSVTRAGPSRARPSRLIEMNVTRLARGPIHRTPKCQSMPPPSRRYGSPQLVEPSCIENMSVLHWFRGGGS
jgi:hypothetical protein